MDNRPTRQEALVSTAFIWAARSTCSRLHVGAVIHRDGRILVQGYNGAPAGLPHCNHFCNCRLMLSRGDNIWRVEERGHGPHCPSELPCTNATHAEQNAITWAARVGVGIEGAELVCTHQPCESCARSLINAGIRSVIYVEPYRLVEGLELLQRAGIEVSRIFASPNA